MRTPRPKPRSNTKNNNTRVRTPRACDRCRNKKAKVFILLYADLIINNRQCDGGNRCSTCRTSESACTYTHRRRRELRRYYGKVTEAMEEGLQRLYWACRQRSDFPGAVPDETSGFVTTAAILEGLGINVANIDEIGPAQGLKPPVHSYAAQTQPLLGANTSPVEAVAPGQHHSTAETFVDAHAIEQNQEPGSSTATSFELVNVDQTDIYEQLAMVNHTTTAAQLRNVENIDFFCHTYYHECAIELFPSVNELEYSASLCIPVT